MEREYLLVGFGFGENVSKLPLACMSSCGVWPVHLHLHADRAHAFRGKLTVK